MTDTLRAASSISGLTLVSRILGLVRDVLMAHVLGKSWAFGTLILAWTFPNMLRRLMGEGALSASFIPAFASTLDRDGKPAATRLLASVSGALLAALIGVSAVVVALCFVLPPTWFGSSHANSPGDEASGTLLLHLSAILFPYVIVICLAAIYNGALNSLKVFAWPAALPAVLNLFWIAAMLVGVEIFGTDSIAITELLAWSLLAAGLVQLAIPIALLRRHGALPRPRIPAAGDPARAVFVSMAPTMLGMSMLQLNTLFDLGFAYWLIEPGAPTHVYYANRLMSFPFALTTLALATAVFPSLAVLASREQLTAMRSQVGSALRYTLFLSAPASLGLLLIAPDFLQLFFVNDKYTLHDAGVTSITTACLVAGLPFVGSAQLHARALYALGDMKSPAVIACVLVPINLALNGVFLFALDLGVAGLTLATSVCAVLHSGMLRRKVVQRSGPLLADATSILRITGCTVLMGGVVWGTQQLFAEGGVLRLAIPIALGMASYGLCHWLTGGEELRRFAARIAK